MLDNRIVVLRHFAKIKTDCISFFKFTKKLLLDISVFFKFAFFPKFGELIVQLLASFGASIDSFCLALVNQYFMQDQAIEETWVHVRVWLRLQHILQLLQNVQFKAEQVVIIDF